MSFNRKWEIGLLALGLLLASASGPAQAQAALPVPNVSQAGFSNWCWAATSEAVLRFTGNAPGMCNIADWARQQNSWGSDNCCSNGAGPICNKTNAIWGAPGSMEKIFDHWGAQTERKDGFLSLKEAQDSLDDDSPTIVRWAWTAGGGHFVVLHGYSGSMMTVMDPWNGPTSLSYANLVSTSARNWTHSLTVKPRKVTYVVDDTGSMGDEIASVRNTLVAQVEGFRAAGTFVKYTLITYKDSPFLRGSTTDHNEILNWISALGADGGGDCPEEGYGALDLAAEEAPGSEIWWMTDADSHGGFLRLLLTRARLFLAGNTLNSTILGSCSGAASAGQGGSISFDAASTRVPGPAGEGANVSAFAAGELLSRATGGLYFAVTSSDIAAATQIVFEENLASALIQRLALPAGPHTAVVPVDDSTEILKVTLDIKAGATGVLTIAKPDGSILGLGSPGVREIVAGASRMIIVERPALAAGRYTITMNSTAEYFVSVSSHSPHAIHLLGEATVGVDQEFQVRLAFESLTPPTGPAGPGSEGPGGPLDLLEMPAPSFPFDPSSLEFFAVQENGQGRRRVDLFDDGLHGDRAPSDGIFGGRIRFDGEGGFRLGVSDSVNFERVAKSVINVGDVAVSGPSDIFARTGSTITHSFLVANLAPISRSFQLGATSSGGWGKLGSVPAQMILAAGEHRTISIDVEIPMGAIRGESDILSLTALAEDGFAVFDSASVRTTAWEGPLLQSISSATASPGDTLVLAGSGFGVDPGVGHRSSDQNNVTMAGRRLTESEVLSWSAEAITVQVPPSAVSGLLFVVASGQQSNALEVIIVDGPSPGVPITEIPTLSSLGRFSMILLLIATATLLLLRRRV